MSKSPDKSAPSPSNPEPGEPASNPSGQPECHAMSDIGAHFQNSDPAPCGEVGCPRETGGWDALTHRQRSALPVIVASPTIRDAAKSLQINERTIYRWLEDEDFREELARLREDLDELAYQELRGLTLRIVSVFAEGMAAPDLATRIRSARYAASYTAQVHEARQLRTDIQALEQAFDEWKAKSPLR